MSSAVNSPLLSVYPDAGEVDGDEFTTPPIT
jgi:hypothetical protein